MSYTDANGNTLSRADVTALLTEQTQEPVYTINSDVYRRFTYPGASTFEGSTSLLFAAGQTITQSRLDALFPAATIASITPSTGPAAGGTVVEIRGTNLGGATGVTFGGAAGTALTVVDNALLRVTTPAGTAGAVDVVVSDDSGAVTVTDGFTYA